MWDTVLYKQQLFIQIHQEKELKVQLLKCSD